MALGVGVGMGEGRGIGIGVGLGVGYNISAGVGESAIAVIEESRGRTHRRRDARARGLTNSAHAEQPWSSSVFTGAFRQGVASRDAPLRAGYDYDRRRLQSIKCGPFAVP